MLIDVWTGLSLQQSTIVASFFTSYLAILVDPKAGRDSIQLGTSVNFRAMKTFEEWDKGDSRHGLAITITKRMQDEMTALQGHIQARLVSNPEAWDLFLEIVTVAMDFLESYVPMFPPFVKICEGRKCSKSLKESCWVSPQRCSV